MQPNHAEILKDLLTASEIAEKYSIDKSTVFKIAKRCKVSGIDLAGRTLFTKEQAKIISKNYYGEPGNPNFKKSS
jgi:hypothetical protein